jgi:hypothetical protein
MNTSWLSLPGVSVSAAGVIAAAGLATGIKARLVEGASDPRASIDIGSAAALSYCFSLDARGQTPGSQRSKLPIEIFCLRGASLEDVSVLG